MLKNLSNKELVSAGHKFAASLDADTHLIDRAKMVSELATRLDVALAAAAEAGKQRDALAAAHHKLRESMAAIHNTIRLDNGHTSLGTILSAAKRAHEESLPTDTMLNAVRAEGGPSVQAKDLKALMRFNDTCDDGEGYDIGDEAMNRLVELGLVAKERGKMRVITSFGMWVIAREQGEESGALQTQRDRDLAFQQRIAQLRAGNADKDGV